MAAPSAVSNFYAQQGNRVVFLSWDPSTGATSYQVQRSTDGVNFGLYAVVPINNYLDTNVTVGTQYWYKIAAAVTNSFQAFGTMTLSGQPNAGDTFTLANVTFTAVSSSPTGNQFLIGTAVTDTITNIVNVTKTALNNIVVPTSSGTIITFTAFQAGPEGSGIQFSNALTNATITSFSGGGTGNISPYSAAQSVIPTPTAEMSLAQLRLMAQQRADRVNSNFVTLPEWNSFINQAMYELYDLLVTADEEYFVATPAQFQSQNANAAQTYLYPLPDGQMTFQNGITGAAGYIAPPFYKLKGVDLGLNSANNAWVTVNKFNFMNRNSFVYPNTASTIYGVFNLQYRLLGNQIEFIPTPSAGQNIRIWYIPRLPQLLLDTDITTTGISGWLQYVIVRAAKYALDKEESDTTKLDQEITYLKQRIEETAANRDTGQPDNITNVRLNGQWGTMNGGYGSNGPIGGY